MALPASSPATVRAPLALPVGMAGEYQQPLRLAGVDPAKRWRGEGHEQPGMPGYRVGDALATSEAGGQELELVGLIGRRAGGTDRHPPIATRLQEGGVRLPVGVVDRADLTGPWVGVVDPATQPNRMGAVAGRGDLFHPAVIAGTGPSDGLGHHLRQQLADQDGFAHPVPSSSRSVGTSVLVVPRRCSARRASSASSRSSR